MRSLAAALLISIVLAGCSGARPPALAVVDARVTDRTSDAYVVTLSIEASNDNRRELPLKVATYTVRLDNGATFTGVRSPETTLRRFGSQRFELPASFVGQPSDSMSYSLSGRVTYVTPNVLGRVLFDAGVSRPTTSLAGKGGVRQP